MGFVVSSNMLAFLCDKMYKLMDRLFGEWLNDEIMRRGWSQAELARRSGISRQAISNYITGRILTPDDQALRSIARGLGYSAEEMYRIAGILPQEQKPNSISRAVLHILSQLPEDQQEDILNYAEYLSAKNARKESRENPAS